MSSVPTFIWDLHVQYSLRFFMYSLFFRSLACPLYGGRDGLLLKTKLLHFVKLLQVSNKFVFLIRIKKNCICFVSAYVHILL
jgi:hypothetical protein